MMCGKNAAQVLRAGLLKCTASFGVSAHVLMLSWQHWDKNCELVSGDPFTLASLHGPIMQRIIFFSGMKLSFGIKRTCSL
ncbi:hypothetical protein Plhal304r1_c070g0158981 [Plasmopara halstedii]